MAEDHFFNVQSGPEGEMIFTLRPRKLKVLPESALSHLRQANMEALLAVRSCLDWAIQRMEPQDEK